jgi:ParB-like chromosome segregation protein Spo0J
MIPRTRLLTVPLNQLVALRRNPQYLSEAHNAALKASIERDGFLAPIVIRKKRKGYEILSGNHRVLSSREAGMKELPCVLVLKCDDKRAARIAVNMNTVHGDPIAQLLAPFLAEADDETIKSIFLDEQTIADLCAFDATLKERLDLLMLPDALDRSSPIGSNPNCICKCGHLHVALAPKTSKSSKRARKTTNAASAS